jgi:predicted nucleic acid-binding protein
MADTARVVYWDACVWLSYVNQMPARMPILDALLHDSAVGSIKLYSSELARVEVAFAATEQRGRALDQQMEQSIDGLWANPEAAVLVEHHSGISLAARTLMREAVTRGWSLKPLDAVHLATAQWLSGVGITVDEFHTYDHRLQRFESLVGCRITEPYTPHPRMF